jgi:predicted enzyme related to lactoylglutathione lyase
MTFRLQLTALLLFAAGNALAAAPTELPPISRLGTAEHHTGKVIWADLVTPDLAAAERFYGGMFGWTFQTIHTGDTDYAVALLDGEPLAGMLQRPMPAGEMHQPAWLTFIAVRDVDAAQRTALSRGAKVLAEPRTYPGRGRQAVFSDPEGAVFAVLASNSGDSADFLAAPGEWIWSSVMVRDPAQEAAFYQSLFGYDVFDVPSDDGLKHVILSGDDYARASVNALPADSARRHPHWLNFVRVVSVPDALSKAAALGGKVLVEPHIDRHGGMVTVIADPAGAPIGLLEWTDNDSTAEPK